MNAAFVQFDFILGASFQNNVSPLGVYNFMINAAINTIFKQNRNTSRIRTTVARYHLSNPFISPLILCCSDRVRLLQNNQVCLIFTTPEKDGSSFAEIT